MHRLAGRRNATIAAMNRGHSVIVPIAAKRTACRPVAPASNVLPKRCCNAFPRHGSRVLQRHGGQPGQAENFVNAVMDGEVDIIVGTQMAAKGHHFRSDPCRHC